MGFKKVGRAFYNHVVELLERPHEFVKQQMVSAPTKKLTMNIVPTFVSGFRTRRSFVYQGYSAEDSQLNG